MSEGKVEADSHRDRRPSASIGLVLAAVAVIAVAIFVIVALPRMGEIGIDLAAGPLTDERAAALVGVPRGQVVATLDGFIAVRVIDPPGDAVQVLLIADGDPEPAVSVLSEVSFPIIGIQPNSNLLWVEGLSCRPNRGLEHPNILFGWAQPAPVQVSLNVPARGTTSGGLFLLVLDDAELAPNQEIVLNLGTAEDRRSGRVFARKDPCTGEPPVGH